MATQNIFQPTYVRSLIPSAPPLVTGGPEAPEFKETAGQTFGVGDLLYFDSNGTLAICTVDGSARLNSQVAVVAEKPAVGTAGASQWAHVITPWDVFTMNVYHSTLGSSVTAQTQQGQTFGIQKVNGIWRLDLTLTAPEATGVSQGYVTVIGFPYKALDGTLNTIGDTHGLVTVRFNEWSISTAGNARTRCLQYA